MNDIIVKNGYPDSDHIDIIADDNGWNITVYRGEDGETYILIADNIGGSETTYILGKGSLCWKQIQQARAYRDAHKLTD